MKVKVPKLVFTTNEEQKKQQSDKKWACWYSAEFGFEVMLFKNAKMHPESFHDGAMKDCAKIAMENFENLWKLDPDCAKMIAGSFSFYIGEMIQTLGDGGQKYYKML